MEIIVPVQAGSTPRRRCHLLQNALVVAGEFAMLGDQRKSSSLHRYRNERNKHMSSNRVPAIVILLATALFVLIAPAAAMAEKPYVPPKDQAVYEKLQHWQDLKFGLFMHWGIYSVWGITESWPICDATPYGRNSSPMWEKSGKDPDKFMQMYFDLNKQFDPEDFNAAGARGRGACRSRSAPGPQARGDGRGRCRAGRRGPEGPRSTRRRPG